MLDFTFLLILCVTKQSDVPKHFKSEVRKGIKNSETVAKKHVAFLVSSF